MSATINYAFKGGTDGRRPSGAFSAADGIFYGTTSGGNRFLGQAFMFTRSGGEHVVHLFEHEKSGGGLPNALTILNGTLYGTTRIGGSYGLGIVYSMTPSGSERVLHNFAGGDDGATPIGLTSIGGKLYGITESGGNK